MQIAQDNGGIFSPFPVGSGGDEETLVFFNQRTITNASIFAQASAIISSIERTSFKLQGTRHLATDNLVMPRTWLLPEQGRYKVNVDGAYSELSQCAGSGGLVRVCQGNFVGGFMHRLTQGDHFDAELWACYFGLKIAWDMGLRSITLETDLSDMMNIITGRNTSSQSNSNLANEIRQWLQRDWTRSRYNK